MSEPKVLNQKTDQQLTDQQLRINDAISREMYSIMSKYKNEADMSQEDKNRLTTLSNRSQRAVSAFIRMTNPGRRNNR